MADRTLTINHADGGSETYTLKTEDVLGVRSMQVDGDTVTIDRTAPDLVRTIIADGQTITIDTTRGGVRTLTVDGTEITIDRTEESNLESFIQQFTGAAAAYSLRDLASNSGNTTVVRVRRSSDNAEADFKASEVSDGTLVAWVGAGNDGFVETWYDQSGNGNDAVQQVSGSQPKIVDAGVLVSDGIEFDGVDDFFETSFNSSLTDYTFAGVYTVKTISDNAGFLGKGIGSNREFFVRMKSDGKVEHRVYSTGSSSTFYTLTSSASAISANTTALIAGAFNGNTNAIRLDINDTVLTATSSVGLYAGTSSLTIPRVLGNEANTAVAELVFYNSDQTANLPAIETNINNQYDIY